MTPTAHISMTHPPYRAMTHLAYIAMTHPPYMATKPSFPYTSLRLLCCMNVMACLWGRRVLEQRVLLDCDGRLTMVGGAVLHERDGVPVGTASVDETGVVRS